MKRRLLLGLGIAMLAQWCAAQAAPTTSDAAAQVQNTNSLPAGTIIPIELSKSLDTRKAKVGDKIEAKLPADLLAHGKIVIPRETKVYGHVTDVKAHGKESPGSKVAIAFDTIAMKKGSEVPIQVVVQAVGRPLQLVDSPAHMSEGAGVSAATASVGSGTGATSPSRAQERVAAIPINGAAGTESDTPPPTTMAPLGPTSKGIVGMKGLALEVSGQTSTISSQTDNVKLESGTQMNLRVQ
ncbi:MAG: hypothetical protein HY010_04305 [Acidobacteria bacterium]|nr:hypothetical protein [Acidobacteriota bacterium]